MHPRGLCLRTALFFALAALALALHSNIKLHSIPNPITLGKDFLLLADVTALDWDHTLFNATCTIAADTVAFLSPHQNVLVDPDLKSLSINAIIEQCPESLPLRVINAQLSCHLSANGTDKPDSNKQDSLPIRMLLGSVIEPKIEVNSGSSSAATAQFILENVVSTVPAEEVTCDIHWDVDVNVTSYEMNITTWDERGIPFSSTEQVKCTTGNHSLTCSFGNFIGHNIKSLPLVLSNPAQKEITLRVSCKDTDDCEVGKSLEQKIELPDPPKLTVSSSPDPAIAGSSVTVTIKGTGIQQTTDCAVTFDPVLHVKAGVSNQCKHDSAAKNYKCVLANDNIVFPFHLDASANISTSPSVKVECGDSLSEQIHLKLASNVSLLADVRKTVSKGDITIQMSVANNGPSDAVNVVCSIYYPKKSLDIETDPGNNITCSISKGGSCSIPFLPGWDEHEQASNISVIYLTSPLIPVNGLDSWQVEANCTAEGHTEHAYKAITVYRNETKSNTDKKPTPTNDNADFWTYTIVIVNLFMIALVVFIGMWWRNRAIARSQAGLPLRMEQEMELMSGERTIGKAD